MPPPRFTLYPVYLHNSQESATLLQQRIECGWAKTPEMIRIWRDLMDQKLKSLFWIVLADGDVEVANWGESIDWEKCVGHVSLDRTSGSIVEDESVATKDGRLMTIASFWISPKQRSTGLGRAVMERLEKMAVRPPYGSLECKAIVVNTLSRRYTFDDSPEWRGMWERVGFEAPSKTALCTEDWYRRMGYVWFKEEPKYQVPLLDGTEVLKLTAVFLRKELQ